MGFTVKFPSETARSLGDWLTSHRGRELWAELLKNAFPGRSENEIAEAAAPILDVTPRTVRNWLRGVHEPKIKHVVAVMLLVGLERSVAMIEGADRP